MTIDKPRVGIDTRNLRCEVIENTLFYLMSRFAAHPCYWAARAILDHLHTLTGPRRSGLSKERFHRYTRLLAVWQSIAQEMETPTPRRATSRNGVSLVWSSRRSTDPNPAFHDPSLLTYLV
jgi:hypothetical protein